VRIGAAVWAPGPPLRRFLRFTRGTDSLQRPVPVDPNSEPRQGPLSDCVLMAANRCAALFVSPVAPDFEIRNGTAVRAPGVDVPPFHPSGYMDKAPVSRVERRRAAAPAIARMHLHRCRRSVSAQMCLTIEQESELAGGWGRMRRFSLQVPRRRAQGCNGFHRQRLIAKKPLRRILRFAPDPAAADTAQSICLSSDALSRNRNSWADGDGSSVCTLIRVRRGDGLKGVTALTVSA
jgi:hypothetical protein